jgi:hypothetical protein
LISSRTTWQDQVSDHVEGDGQMLVEDLGVEADLFLGGEGVEHAADGIHFAGDGFGGAALRALEDHVLHEMGQAVFFRYFAARAVADPHAHGDRADVGHGLGEHHQAVGQDMLLNVARFGRHPKIVTQARRKEKTIGVSVELLAGSRRYAADALGNDYSSLSSGWSLPYSLV